MKEEINITLTEDELEKIQLALWLIYSEEGRDAECRWPYPPPEVAQEYRENIYKLYRKIKQAKENIPKTKEVDENESIH